MSTILASFGLDVLLLLDKRVLWRFRTEGQRDEHEHARHDDDGQQYGPFIGRAQNVFQTQNLRDQYGDGDHQLVNGTDLREEKNGVTGTIFR